jgi:hypothetical protein
VANVTPVRQAPHPEATIVGYLHAGATVARAEEPYSTEGCEAGWYPVRPRGFVCAGESATTNLSHPTLAAMAIKPDLTNALPYSYARAKRDTVAFEVNPGAERAVRRVGSVPSRSGLAVVGSWQATDGDGVSRNLAMMTDGRFIDVGDLEAAKPSAFVGVELDEQVTLPVGFVVKRGVRRWHVDGGKSEKREALEYHETVKLSGRFRTIQGVKFWEADGDRWVRHKDVTVIRRREQYPEFVQAETKWIDISIITGTLVLYEGQNPLFATLVSVGRDRNGDPENTDATAQGEFRVVFKHITATAADPKSFANLVDMYDTPWALELSSGQLLHGSFWHNRFGIEHGPGNVQLAVADAARIWNWASPEVPEGWHAAAPVDGIEPTWVNIR